MAPRKDPVAEYLAKIGRLGGLAKSAAKTEAARRNAKLGGRPRKSKGSKLKRSASKGGSHEKA
jgi:hypothetical protein